MRPKHPGQSKASAERVVKECVADLTLENRLLKKA